jgi:hypothetical protein
VKAAKGRGVKFGRKPKLSPQQIAHARKLIDDGQRRDDVAALQRWCCGELRTSRLSRRVPVCYFLGSFSGF